MQLGIYSLEKVLYHGAAREVNCVTKSGEITILDHHRPLISILAPGTMKVVDESGQEFYFPVRSGFLEMDARNTAKILVEEAPETQK
jgi:F-type H+-transporting ATPase subunit epsilon